jgi:hypothetical protein
MEIRLQKDAIPIAFIDCSFSNVKSDVDADWISNKEFASLTFSNEDGCLKVFITPEQAKQLIDQLSIFEEESNATSTE